MSQIKVEYIQHIGNAKMVVDAAKVSFGNDIGGDLTDKDKKLIKYLAEHKHMCYSEDTEIFTEKGWISFKDLTYDTKVAAVSKNGDFFEFETPSHIYKNSYKGKMYSINSNKVSFCVTPNHRMFFQQRGPKGFKDFDIQKIENIYSKNIRFKSTAKLKGEGSIEDFYKGCLFGFYLGDGFLSSTNYVGFRLKKCRKINFLQDILDKLNLSYSKKITKSLVTEIKVDSKLFSELVLTAKAADKFIPEILFQKSPTFLDGLFTGLINSDGHKKSRNAKELSFSSTSEKLLNDFGRLATLLGKYPKRNKDFLSKKITITNKCYPRVNDSRLSIESFIYPKQYNGDIYCCTVSTGLLLVRRNGKQVISGNSPFEHCQLTVKISCPLYIRSQIHRHRTFSYNEISRRYTSKNMEFYKPEVYRKQHEANKQASYGALDPHVQEQLLVEVEDFQSKSKGLYDSLLAMGVCREQARGVLCQDLMTEFYMTGNLRNWAHFLDLRDKPDAQVEVQVVAQQVKEILLDKFEYAAEVLHDRL